MITREQLKAEIDNIDSKNVEILHQIIQGLQAKSTYLMSNHQNPLKESVTYENDIISPVNISWDADS